MVYAEQYKGVVIMNEKEILSAILKNQEQMSAQLKVMQDEFLMMNKNMNERFNNQDEDTKSKFNEVHRRFDDVDIELRGIRRHVDITERELDRTIIHRLEKIELNASH
jgi:hypothetical protein